MDSKPIIVTCDRDGCDGDVAVGERGFMRRVGWDEEFDAPIVRVYCTQSCSDTEVCCPIVAPHRHPEDEAAEVERVRLHNEMAKKVPVAERSAPQPMEARRKEAIMDTWSDRR